MASNAIIQCGSSSSSHAIITNYDVFVSFRGEDTRNNFTAFLFDALSQNGIHAFKDDTHIQKGESIAPELLLAIQESRLFLVVFSKNYASSTWCLRELAHICNCTIESFSSRVLPIFYDVDPSEVRKQSGYYGRAFATHEGRFREDREKMEEVQRWREALTQVANNSGWDIQNESQPAMIKEIVQEIKYRLGPKFQNLPNGNLVGMESRVEELEKCLELESISDVRVVGISGMGGIGKTTLARALYEKIADQYDVHCFVDDVNKIYQHSSSLGVQKQLLSQCLNEENLEICNVSTGTSLIRTRLRNKRGLIVLDNVSQVEQLHMFTGNRETLLSECLGGGSIIIIIFRDEHILRTHGVNHVYQVKSLNQENAVQLFCKNAFRCDYIMSGYEMLTHYVLSHAQGHPLAIKVIGNFLYGRNVRQWEGTLVRLSENKSKDIMEVLRTSYDALEEKDKEIFLDIACFFGQDSEDYVKEILDFRGFYPEIGLQILVEKSLITISHGVIHMHSLLRDLGKCIVREKSPKEPRKWSRLWDCENLYKVMSDNMEAKHLKAIVVEDKTWMFFETTMRVDALSKLNHLEFLSLQNVNCTGSLKYLSRELGYLIWHKYPFVCLPPSFQPVNLVELILPKSNIKILWEGKKCLPNLRRVDLSYSKNLIKMPNFGEALNLERLNLEGCIQLKHIGSSIGHLRKLTSVILENCKGLVKLPNFGEGHILQCLNLGGCIQLSHINPSIGLLKKLTFLNLKDCKSLVSLPNYILSLSSLECLNLSGCSKLNNIGPLHSIHCWFPPCMRQCDISFCNLLQIPDAIGDLPCLETLNVSGNNFATLPNLKELRRLFHLNLQHCKKLKDFPELPSRVDLLSKAYMPPWPVIEPLPRGRVAGLYIFNCPKLVEREHCASKTISWMIKHCASKTISWMIKVIQEGHQYKQLEFHLVFPRIEVIIPGSEIPWWFNNRHEGSLISIDPSSILQRDNICIGVVCCAVFSARHFSVTSPPKTNGVFPANVPVVLEGDLITDNLDHLGLFFFTMAQFFKTCSSITPNPAGDVKWKFEIRDQKGFDVEVKKCGYRWVYEKDLLGI
ncbi:hypothetical protein JHK87_016518 [Glycine soja]|nr:hypothetical protein JHK87_016518 [Glycine soja]